MRHPIRRSLSGAVFLVSLGAAPQASLAQQPVSFVLPDILVTATRMPTEKSRTAGSVTVVTEEDIKRKGYRSLDEALNDVPGVSVTRSGPIGSQSSIFMRGAESDHVLVLMDGVPLNDPSAPGNSFDFGRDLLANVARIEVFRGPGATLYGSNAIGGVINIIPKVGGDSPFSGKLTAGGGSRGSAAGSLEAHGSTDSVDYGVSFSGLTTDGFSATGNTSTSYIDDADANRNLSANGKLVLHASDDLRFSLSGMQRRSEGDLDSSFTTRGDHQIDFRMRLAKIGTEYDWLDGRAMAQLSSSVTEHDRKDLAPGQTDYRGMSRNVALTNAIRTREEDGLAKAFALIGYDWDSDEYEPSNATARERKTEGGFVEAGFDPIDPVTLSGSVRRELPNDYAGETTWRLGAIWRLPGERYQAFVSAGTGFHAPSLSDLYGFGGNTALKAERSKSYEIGLRGNDLPVWTAQELRGDFELALFDTTINDVIVYDNAANQLRNVNRLDSRGVELSGGLKLADWLEFAAAYTYTQALNEQSQRDAARRPRHLASVSLTYLPVEGSEATIGMRHQAKALDTDFGTARIDAHSTVYLTGRTELRDGLALFAYLNNALDEEYEPAAGFMAEGRTIFAGLEWNF